MGSVAEVQRLPTDDEAAMAAEVSRKLAAIIGSGDEARLRLIDGEEMIEVPVHAIRLLSKILDQMAQGNAVSLVPVGHMLTTQQAADILNVSRPYLVKLLEEGQLPFTKVGRHRRIKFEDLMKYRQESDRVSQEAMEELAKEAQEINLGY